MPNYSLVVGSRFTPLTYDEIVKPLQQATDLQNAYEDALGELSTEAAVWENRINRDTDQEVAERYQKYVDDLRDRAYKLATQGLTPGTRQSIIDMKRRYASEITPIQEAYTSRQKDIERQQKAADASGGRTIFSRDARITSLSDYMRGVDDYKQANLDAIMKEAATGAASISSRYFDTYEGKRFGNDYLSLMQEQGIRPGDAIRILEGKYGNSQQFQDFKDFIEKGLSKYQGFGEQQDLINSAFMQGINEGIINKRDEKLQDNWREKLLAQGKGGDGLALQFDLEDALGNPYPLDVRLDVNKSMAAHNNFSNYFDRNGNLTEEGWKQYGTNIVPSPGPRSMSPAKEVQTDFKKFIDSITDTPISSNPDIARAQIEKAYRDNAVRLKDEGVLNADTFRNRAFDLQFEDQKKVLQTLTSGKNTGNVPTDVYTTEGYKYSKNINLNDNEFKNATFAGEYGLQGNYIVITTTKGEQYRVPLKTINKNLDDAITTSLRGAMSGYFSADGIKYTDEELDRMFIDPNTGAITSRRSQINKRLNAALNNFASAFTQVKSEDYKVEGGLH